MHNFIFLLLSSCLTFSSVDTRRKTQSLLLLLLLLLAAFVAIFSVSQFLYLRTNSSFNLMYDEHLSCSSSTIEHTIQLYPFSILTINNYLGILFTDHHQYYTTLHYTSLLSNYNEHIEELDFMILQFSHSENHFKSNYLCIAHCTYT